MKKYTSRNKDPVRIGRITRAGKKDATTLSQWQGGRADLTGSLKMDAFKNEIFLIDL